MMIVYTPGEMTKTLITRFRLAYLARQTFRCEWMINRDDSMNFVLQRGAGTNKKKIRVCLMVGKTETITQDMSEQIGAILSQLLDKYDADQDWLQFGFKNGEGPTASVKLSEAKLRILQELKLNRECIAV